MSKLARVKNIFRKKNILVVDDNVDILDVLRLVLEDAGYKVETSIDDEPIERIIKGELVLPDVLLLDILLGEKNGLEIAERLKNGAHTSALPIILMSAHKQATNESKSRKNFQFLPKPFKSQEILEAIESVA